MSSGADAWLVWGELSRIEERLSWGGGAKPGRVCFDSLGRPLKALARADAQDAGDAQRPVSRVQRVHYALQHAAPRAQKRIAALMGDLDLTDAGPILIAACEEIALLRGAVVAPGVNPRGLKAPPFGADDARDWLIDFLGLMPSADATAALIPGAWRFYERGFRQAWGPTRTDRHQPLDVNGAQGNVLEAALDFSKGHVVMAGILLTLLAGHLLRGSGDKAAMLDEIGRSGRLGPVLATWVGANEDRLLGLIQPQAR
ncbi:MAG TPA: hypothetical protein VGM74_19985 [Burkholderiaceae bacterium]|jgi:hypothetical protein